MSRLANQLEKEVIAEIFEYKEGSLYWLIEAKDGQPKGTKAGRTTSNGYRQIKYNGKLYMEHILIWVLFGNELPKGFLLDHINRIKDDNRIENLRIATRSQNIANSSIRKNCKSKYKGVIFNCNKWQARISVDNKRISLGYFIKETDAALAYNKAALEYFREFANLNIIEKEINNGVT